MMSILAQVVTVWVIFIQGQNQMYPSDFISTTMPEVQSAYLDFGVYLNFQRVAVYAGNFPAPTIGDYSSSYYRKLYSLARDLKLLKRNRILFFIAPPSSDGGYMFGAARRFCFKERRANIKYLPMGFGTGQVYNINGDYRLTPYVSTIVAHELGHSINAQHQNDCTMMDTNALQCTQKSLINGKLLGGELLPFNKRSQNEIRKCVSWRRNK